ncbi:TonB-dependent receptor [Sphingobium sp.]|uniref:TonB-dependent receptor n=1 Tax=Sphingobium sp. TaxID=1912891 RepID=UPI0028BD20BB|nr:TonB-dependent receptor [Sphingobium sp.]
MKLAARRGLLNSASLVACVVPLGLGLGATAALAQPKDASFSPNPGGIFEIVVTATKRPENIRDVPFTVTAITSADLAQRQIVDAQQLPQLAPSLQLQSSNAAVVSSNFSIRGVGTLSFQQTIDASVSVVIDDIVMGRPEVGVIPFSDIAQVEVLNGPQGMLFGKNASAGVVSIHTTDPEIGKTSGRLGGQFGFLNTADNGTMQKVDGTINIPTGAESALRLNAVFMNNSPIVKNVLDVPGSDYGQTQYGLRAKHLWDHDGLRVLLSGDYFHSKGAGGGATTDRSLGAGSPYAALDAAAGIIPGPENTLLASDGRTDDHFSVGGIQANVDYEFSNGGRLTNIAAWRRYTHFRIFDVDSHQIDLLNINHENSKFSQFSNELRYTSAGGGQFEYQFGAFYMTTTADQHVLLFGNLGSPSAPPGYTATLGNDLAQTQKTTSVAGFGQATLRLTDAFRLVAGGRVTYDKVKINGVIDTAGSLYQIFPSTVVPTTSVDHTDFSWRGSAQYDIADRVTAYATVARGYKGPGFNQFTARPVRSETSMMYEAGLKTELLDRRLLLNLAVFKERFKDFQAQTFNPSTLNFEILNAGVLNSKGFEGDFRFQPTDGLTLTGSIAYVDATFGRFVGDQCYAAQPATGPRACVGGVTDSSGNRLPNAPKWAGTLSARYEHSVGGNLIGAVQAATYSRSRVFFASNNDPSTVHPGYTLLDLGLELKPESGPWKLSLFCRNCTDKRFATFIQSNPFSGNDYGQQFSLGSFRMIGASVDLAF